MVKPGVVTVLREIHILAPNVRVIVMGYPKLWKGPGSPTSPDTPSIAWLGAMAEYLDNALSAAAVEASQRYAMNAVSANPISMFDGVVSTAIRPQSTQSLVTSIGPRVRHPA